MAMIPPHPWPWLVPGMGRPNPFPQGERREKRCLSPFFGRLSAIGVNIFIVVKQKTRR